jgi:hypothetical protein
MKSTQRKPVKRAPASAGSTSPTPPKRKSLWDTQKDWPTRIPRRIYDRIQFIVVYAKGDAEALDTLVDRGVPVSSFAYLDGATGLVWDKDCILLGILHRCGPDQLLDDVFKYGERYYFFPLEFLFSPKAGLGAVKRRWEQLRRNYQEGRSGWGKEASGKQRGGRQ